MRLREIAFSRCGDKGDISNICVFPYDEADWEYLRAGLTADRVAEHFSRTVTGPVTRFELPRLHAFNFVLEGALDGGGAASLYLDSLGKTYQSFILDMELDGDPPSLRNAGATAGREGVTADDAQGGTDG